MTSEVVAHLLAADKTVQGFALAVTLGGLLFSVPLVVEAWRDLRAVHGNGDVMIKRMIARQGFRSQASICFVQSCLFVITAAALTLPPIPVYEMGTHITVVIALRKGMRLLMTCVLAYQAWAARATRQQVFAHLTTTNR